MIIGIEIGSVSGVAVYDEGKIIYAASEERFTRRKNDSSYPSESLKSAISICGITPEKVEKVVIASENKDPDHLVLDVGSFEIEDYIKEQNEYWKPILVDGLVEDEFNEYLEVFPERCLNTNYPELLKAIEKKPLGERKKVFNSWRIERVCEDLMIDKDRVELVNHDFSHAAYGLYGSDYTDRDDVLVVVYDGFSDDGNASIYTYEDNRLFRHAVYQNYNVGRFYRYITLLLGMKQDEHEYKVMGLAPYATKYIYEKPLSVMRNAYKMVDGKVVIDPNLKDNYHYFKDKFDGMRFDGIAAAVQIRTEELNRELIEYWLRKLNKKRVSISGGVSMNIKANMEIAKSDLISDLFVPGSGGDESLCIGAIFAWLDQNGRSSEIKTFDTLYLGDNPGPVDELLSEVDKSKYDIISNSDADIIAEKLAEGLILGRVSGKMEFGARALGNRSILADPRQRETIDKINKKIKSRDFWMPFTPSIMAEDEEVYLTNPKKLRFPWMSVGCETTEFARNNIKASIHPADATARPQLVSKESNYEYHELLSAFKRITGVGVLLNTSLNIHGYPIVRTCREAYRVLEATDLDGIILDKTLILKKSS